MDLITTLSHLPTVQILTDQRLLIVVKTDVINVAADDMHFLENCRNLLIWMIDQFLVGEWSSSM